MNTPTPEVVKWYTRARKFPQLIGRTPDGAKIWGGPYTFTQAIGAGILLVLGVNTMGLWARYGLIGNAVLLLGVTYGVVLFLGKIPVGSRSPLSVATGALRAVTSPRTGRLAGRPVRLRKPHQVRHRITVLLDRPPAPVAGRLPAAAAHRAAPVPRSKPKPKAKPHPVPHPVPQQAPQQAPQPAPQPATQAAPAPRRQIALSGVQLLLAQAGNRPSVQED